MNAAADKTANPAGKLLTPVSAGSLKPAETLVRAAGLEPARASAQQILRLRLSPEKSTRVRRNGPDRGHGRSMGCAGFANPEEV